MQELPNSLWTPAPAGPRTRANPPALGGSVPTKGKPATCQDSAPQVAPEASGFHKLRLPADPELADSWGFQAPKLTGTHFNVSWVPRPEVALEARSSR